MLNALSQIDLTQGTYASSTEATKERPAPAYYGTGVAVLWTAPAKWWNWLWNKITAFLTASKTDRNALLSEMQSVLTEAGITPDAADNHQLSKAIDTVCYNQDLAYDNETVTEEIGGVMVTHPKNRPYVVGHTVYYPDTELL